MIHFPEYATLSSAVFCHARWCCDVEKFWTHRAATRKLFCNLLSVCSALFLVGNISMLTIQTRVSLFLSQYSRVQFLVWTVTNLWKTIGNHLLKVVLFKWHLSVSRSTHTYWLWLSVTLLYETQDPFRQNRGRHWRCTVVTWWSRQKQWKAAVPGQRTNLIASSVFGEIVALGLCHDNGCCLSDMIWHHTLRTKLDDAFAPMLLFL